MEYTIDTFDWKYYINQYQDIREAGILTKEKAWWHWCKYGKNENRRHRKNFIINEKENKKILVALPTYNRSEKIKDIIEQFSMQTAQDYILFIIDDGSNRHHKEIIEKTVNNNNKIKLIRNEKNLHIAKSLNKSIEYFLKNEFSYFTWISDDNIYDPKFLEILRNNTIDFCYSNYTLKNEITDEIVENTRSYDNVNELLKNFNGCASFMWSKNAIKNIGFYTENINGCEDYDYLVRTFMTVKNKNHINQSLMTYVRHKDALFAKDKNNILLLKEKLNKLYESLQNEKKLIYYSRTKYDKLFQRPHQIMRFFNKNYCKIFIGDTNKIKYEKKYNLIILPYSMNDAIKNSITNESIIYLTDPTLYDEIKTLCCNKWFDLIDAPIDEFKIWNANLKNCVNKSDYITYSHPQLVNFLNEIDNSREYKYISNACDYEHFSKSKNRINERPNDFPKTDKPILGYYGSFAEWLDYDIIRKYADEGKYHIVMIGGIKGNTKYNIRFEHSNITWLDHKSYDKLPYYLSWFDKCFLPFKDCELTKYVNPCKLWEYMASEKEIIKHNVNMNVDEIVTYDDVCKNIINIILNKNKNIAIVLDKYLKGGIEKHTDLLENELNVDVFVFNKSSKSHKKINDSICSKYDVVLWQNVFNKLPPKTTNQKYIYIVHSQCNWWNDNQKMIVKENNHLIDIYIYVSNSVKDNFEKNILKPDNCYVIENQLPEMKNDMQEIQNLFISSGSFNKMKGHYELIKEFSKLDNSNTLEIYGDIHDLDYFNMLKKYISDNKLDNIKLFEYTDEYIERLKEAEYFCLFSKSEGCSYSILEAISLNKKIICTKECLTSSIMEFYPNKKNTFTEFSKVYYYVYPSNIFFSEYNNILYNLKIKKKYIGRIKIDNNDNYQSIEKDINTENILNPGLSFLLRIRNEEDYILKNIYQIYNSSDEIICVDNNSTDNTNQILKYFDKYYSKVFLYNYNIKYDKFNISTYYNWGLSKVTKYNIIKWDGDFELHTKNNLEILVKKYNLRERNDKFCIWFTGLTKFYNKFINLNSNYDEYRVFSKKNGFKWTNGDIYETSENYVKSCPNKIIFNCNNTNNSTDKIWLFEDSNIKNHFENFIFIENKNATDFKYKTNENRDIIDNSILVKYDLKSQKINLKNVLIIVNTKIQLGGTNTFNNIVKNYLGNINKVEVIEKNNLTLFLKKYKDYKIKLLLNNCYINYDDLIFYNKYFNIDYFLILHSEISYYNKYITEKSSIIFNKIIFVNESSFNKFRFLNNKLLLKNNILLKSNKIIKNNNDKFKILYFSRNSPEKNLFLLIYIFNNYKMKNIELHIYTDNEVEKYINCDSIYMHPFTTTLNKNDIYKLFDMTILPSVSEGTSYSILESINNNIPVLCTKINSNNEIIRNQLPQINFEGLQKKLDENNYILDYNDIIKEIIGYDPKNNSIDNEDIFNKNIIELKDKIIDFKNNINLYVKKTKNLKNLIEDNYFNIFNYVKNLNNIIFDNYHLINYNIVSSSNRNYINFNSKNKHKIVSYLQDLNKEIGYIYDCNNLYDEDILIICNYFDLNLIYNNKLKNTYFKEKKIVFDEYTNYYAHYDYGKAIYKYVNFLNSKFKLTDNFADVNTVDYLIIHDHFYTNIFKCCFWLYIFNKDNYYSYYYFYKSQNKFDKIKYNKFISSIIKRFDKKNITFSSKIFNENNFFLFLNNNEKTIFKKNNITNITHIENKKNKLKLDNLIIKKYFDIDLREEKLIKILKFFFEIKSISNIIVNNNLNLSELSFENNTKNLILDINDFITKDFIDNFENLKDNYIISQNNSYFIYNKNDNLPLKTNNLLYSDFGFNKSKNKNFYPLDKDIYDYYYDGISFIVRFYNEEKYMKIILNDILNKSKKFNINFEYIFINNKSDDNSCKILLDFIEKHKELPIKLIHYNIKNNRPGIENYKGLINNKENMLSYFYNWCFSQSIYSYSMKYDCDFLLKNNIFEYLNNIPLNLQFLYNNLGDTLFYYNKKTKIIKDSSSYEFRIYHKNIKFVSSKYCETLCDNRINEGFISTNRENIFYEIKDIEIDKNREICDTRDLSNKYYENLLSKNKDLFEI